MPRDVLANLLPEAAGHSIRRHLLHRDTTEAAAAKERDGVRLVDATWDYCFKFLLSDLLSARITLTVLQPAPRLDRSPSTVRKGLRKLWLTDESHDHIVMGETAYDLKNLLQRPKFCASM